MSQADSNFFSERNININESSINENIRSLKVAEPGIKTPREAITSHQNASISATSHKYKCFASHNKQMLANQCYPHDNAFASVRMYQYKEND